MMRSCKAQLGRHGPAVRPAPPRGSAPRRAVSNWKPWAPVAARMGDPQTSPVSLAHGGQVSTTRRDRALVSGRQGGRGQASPHHLEACADGGETDPLKTRTSLQVQPDQQRGRRVRRTRDCTRGEAGRPTTAPRIALLFSAVLGKGPHCPTCGVSVPRPGMDPRPTAAPAPAPRRRAPRKAPLARFPSLHNVWHLTVLFCFFKIV